VLSSESPEPYPEPPSQAPSGKRNIKDELADKYFSVEIIDSGRRGLVESSDELEIIGGPESPPHNPRPSHVPKRTLSTTSLSQAAAEPSQKKRRRPRAATPYPRKKPTATMAMPVRGAEPATKPHKPLDMALKPRPHTAMRDDPLEQTRLSEPALQSIGSGNVVKISCSRSEEALLEQSVNQTMGSGNVTQQLLALTAEPCDNPTRLAQLAKHTSQPIHSSDVQSPRPRTAKLRSASTEQTRLEKPANQPIGSGNVAEKPFCRIANLPSASAEKAEPEKPGRKPFGSLDVVQKPCLDTRPHAAMRDNSTEQTRLQKPTIQPINCIGAVEEPRHRREKAQHEERANQPIVSSNVTQKPDARDAEQRRFRTKTVCLEERSRLPFDSPERSPTPFIERILQHQGFAPTPLESDISALLHNHLDRGMLVNLPVDLTRLGVPGPSVVLTNGKDFFRVAAVVEHLTHKDGGDKALSNVPAWEPSIGEPVNVVDLEREDDDRIMVFRNGRIQWV
jgi:hypothetical protein